jgi:Ser/Thr protein kinase RdoA (MazF antagonist)
MKLTWNAAEKFAYLGDVIDVREHGNGNINDTYLVTVNGDENDMFVLQRINTHVFNRPELIIRNLRTFIEHVDQRLEKESPMSTRRWDVPHIRKTRTGDDFYRDSQGGFWRAISFINHSQSYEAAQSEDHAREVGYALGRFQSLLSDLSIDKMHDTLEGFHITPQYLLKYDQTLLNGVRKGDSLEVRYCHRMVEERRKWLTVLEDARENGQLRARIIHGDPKINNIMICDQTGQAVSVIDLDTVKPGLVQYDIGDCLRSSCNPQGEDAKDWEDVRFETDLAKAILEGYVSVAKDFLTDADYAYFFDAIRLLTFECGLRFFQDYLAGDIYFKVKHPKHNLERAVVQFKLTESIEAQEGIIRALIENLKSAVM